MTYFPNSPVLVYAPGAPATARPANVFTEWGALMSAREQIAGLVWVDVDPQFGGSPVVTARASAYQMRSTIVRGSGLAGTPVAMTVEDGATFENLERLEWVRLDYDSDAGPAMAVAPGLSYFRMWGASIQNAGTAPFFDVTTGGAIFLTQFENASGFNPFGGTPVVALGAAGVLSYSLDEASTNGLDTVSGTAGSSVGVVVRDPSARYVAITAPVFTGTLSALTYVAIAENLSYTAAPGVFAGTAPTQQQQATERIAAALNGLLDGSIAPGSIGTGIPT